MRPTSRGIAFLEFPNATLLQQALKLHHTDLDGRIINVELTVGGGGSGIARKEKLDARKGRMTEQRDRKAEKEAEEGGDAQAPSQGEGEIKTRGGRRVKPRTDGQVSDLNHNTGSVLTSSHPIVHQEGTGTREVEQVVEAAAEEATGVVEVVVVEVDTVVEAVDEADTVRHRGARSGSLQGPMLSTWDRLVVPPLILCCTYTAMQT
jgi:hypothetical protein